MAKADQNNLRRSARESTRQERKEQPKTGGASGTPEEASAEAAEIKARKRLGKTGKHTSEDSSV
jgi:hypothetical protein